MSRNLALYLDDILTSIDKIERYTTDFTQEVLLPMIAPWMRWFITCK